MKNIQLRIGGARVRVETVEQLANVTAALVSFQQQAREPLQQQLDARNTAMREIAWLQQTIERLESDLAAIVPEHAGAIAGRDSALQQLAEAREQLARTETIDKTLLEILGHVRREQDILDRKKKKRARR